VLKPPIGEVYVSIEAPKGELGYFVVSDGTIKPLSRPGAASLFPESAGIGKDGCPALVADVVAIIGTIDIVLDEVDR
jgi:NADH-quinone oxidoreductase subunit D